MNNIEDQYQEVIETFPNAITVDNIISHVKIPINNGSFIDIDFKNYPKKPKVTIVNPRGQVFKKLANMIPLLYSWRAKTAPQIVEVINEVFMFIKNSISKEIFIKKELLDGILGLCQEHHPREIIGLLRVENDVVSEFILPPGALTSAVSGLFFPNRIPLDFSLQGTIHSHPSGTLFPSPQDLKGVFRKMRFNFIVGYPYNLNSTRCFDRKGKELTFKVV